MSNKKNFFLLISVIFLCATTFTLFSFVSKAEIIPSADFEQKNEAVGGWYYNQLDKTAKKLYTAIEQLYKSGDMKSGVGSYNLVANNVLSEAEIVAFINGNYELGKSYQNARDAFEKDYYDIFYIDFTKLTLKIGKLGGTHAALINNGSNINYYAKGFENAEQVETAIINANNTKTDLIAKVNKLTGNKTYATDKIITLVHNVLVEALQYTYPDEAHLFVSGVYSAYNGGFANCVGYSTLFKWILEEYEIDSVLVSGVAVNSNDVSELHQWNYVEIDNLWFAVDVTWDDPIIQNYNEEIKTTYLLKGGDDFGANHYPQGVFSPNGMTFTYPTLHDVSYSYYISSKLEDDSTDLKVYTEKLFDKNNIEHTNIIVSYLGKTINELEKEGLYLAGRFAFANESFEQWVQMDLYNLDLNSKTPSFMISKEGSIQLCITTIKQPVGKLSYDIDLSKEGKNTCITSPFKLPYFSDYVSPPFIRKSSPFLGKRILPKLTHFEVEFDEEFIKLNENEPISISVNSAENLSGKVTNITTRNSSFTLPTGKVRVSTIVNFDFLPEDTYQSYINTYYLQVENVIGKTSGKAPNTVPVNVTFDMYVPCPATIAKGSLSTNAFVVALPTLVINENLDIFSYDGTSNAINPMDIRLIASIPNEKKQSDLLVASGESNILSSSVYDLSLSCRDQLVRLNSDINYNVTIGLPYPEGYNYNDNDKVEFKAYHYIKQADGSYISEELICRISERGLEILVKDFSPFAIIAVPKADKLSTNKFISAEVITNGGDILTEIESDNGMVTISGTGLINMTEGTEKSFIIKTNPGYVVDKVFFNGSYITPVNNRLTFDYTDISADNVLCVSFIGEKVKEENFEQNFDVLSPNESLSPPLKNIFIPSLKFENKNFYIESMSDPINFMIELENLPNGYKVVYGGNIFNSIGNHIARATIYKLLDNGEIDATYKPLVLTSYCNVILSEPEKSNITLIVSLSFFGILLIVGVIAFVILKKRKTN